MITFALLAALAQASPPTAVSGVVVTARRATPVAELDVTAHPCPEPDPARYDASRPPVVVDTYPRAGQAVAPGFLVVRVSFDQPMACYWAVRTLNEDEDPCEPAGAWELPGRTTWRMKCRVTPNARYTIRFGDVDGHRFVAMSGREAPAREIVFTTSDDPPTASVQEALRADPAGPAQGRIAGYVTCSDARFGPAERCRHTADFDVSPPSAH